MHEVKDVGAQRIEEAVAGFVFHCRYEKNLHAKTIRAYETDLKQFRDYVAGNTGGIVFIKEVNRDVIKAYIQTISGFKPKTVKRKIASLKAMFNYIEYENEAFINPFRRIKIRLKDSYTLPTVMTIHEVKKILAAMYKEHETNVHVNRFRYKAQARDIAIVELLFATGIRVSELCNLRASDIDTKFEAIKVFGKGRKERIIQLCDPELKSSLRHYKKLFHPKLCDDGYFFINRLGKQTSTQSVRLMLKKHIRKAGLGKDITPHTFRHTFATLLLEENVDIRYIQHILGHSTIMTTQIYTHVNTKRQRQILTSKHPRRRFKLRTPPVTDCSPRV